MRTMKFLIGIFSLSLFANSALASIQEARRVVQDKKEILPDCESAQARKGESCQEYINAVNSLTEADFLELEKADSLFRDICDYNYFKSEELKKFCNPPQPEPKPEPQPEPAPPVVEEPSIDYSPAYIAAGTGVGVTTLGLIVFGVVRLLL